MFDNLGDRMKRNYEDRAKTYLPRRTNTIIRVDGKAFHTFTKNCKRPFDDILIEAMDITAYHVALELQGCKLAYVQSDEISFLLTDYDSLQTDAWFNGNVQKICSVAASTTSSLFNWFYRPAGRPAIFDARVFTIPELSEVSNYFLWRSNDATRNSISMVAQSLYSHSELQYKSCNEMQEMIFQKGTNWNDISPRKKHGGLVIRENGKFKSVSIPDTHDYVYWNNIITNSVIEHVIG